MHIIKYHSGSWRINIGLAIVLSGLPVIWVIRPYLGATGDQVYSIAAMAVAIILMLSWERVFGIRVEHTNWLSLSLLPLFFAVPAVIFGLIEDIPGDLGPYYLIYSIAFLIVILSQPLPAYFLLPRAVVTISIISAIATLWHNFFGDTSLTEQIVGEAGGRLYSGDSNNPNFIAFVAGYGLIGLAMSVSRNASLYQWLIFALFASILSTIVFMAGTRSVMFGLSFTGMLGLYFNSQNLAKNVFLKPLKLLLAGSYFLGILFAVLGFYLFFRQSTGFSDFVVLYDTIERSLLEGVQGFVLGQSVTDQSTLERMALREIAIDGLNFIGNGYGSLYIDNPLLQAFYDLGVLGGLMFAFTALIIPVLIVWQTLKGTDTVNPAPRFAAYVYAFNMPNLLLHGRPYDFALWLPIMIVYGLCLRLDRR